MMLFIIQILLFSIIVYGVEFLSGVRFLTFSTGIIALISWVVTMWLTHKHKPKIYQRKLKYVLASFPKAFIIQLVFTLVGLLLIQESISIIKMVLTSVVLYAVIEYIFMLFWFRIRLSNTKDNVKADIARYSQSDLELELSKAPGIIQKESFDRIPSNDQNPSYLFGLYQRINKDNDSVNPGKLFFGSIEKLISSGINDYSLIIISDRINDLNSINQSLKSCYNHLIPHGIIIVNYHSITDTNALLKQKFTTLLFPLVYPIHWFFYRVLSKTKLKTVQDRLSRGRNKVISWVEVSGRLAYSGFDIELEERHQNKQFVVARKTKTISDNPNPSYYILIKLNRVSLYGNIVKINKVRSMYPYSEFLQKKIFEQNNMGNTGKVQDDPRITPQGRIFRKYWIDELPQLLDWLRGEIKLVGIRAMSQHFFSLYSQEYKDKYLQVKPGIISPIFDEKTDAFKDIERIEYAYLESYLKSPVQTDWKYFWITFSHILSGVRSK